MNAPLPEEIARFIAAAVVTGDMVLPWHYPAADDLAAVQIGYRVHGNTGASLVSYETGAWQPGWWVIAQNYFGDPFFIDMGEQMSGFPVYYALHGAGRWDVVTLAPSCRAFGTILTDLRDDGGVDALEQLHAAADHPLWQEVITERRERAGADGAEPVCDLQAIEYGDLVVTGIGVQKMKIIQILRKAMNLSLQAAMALAAEPEILVGSGPRVRFGRIENDLRAHGASVEFRPHN